MMLPPQLPIGRADSLDSAKGDLRGAIVPPFRSPAAVDRRVASHCLPESNPVYRRIVPPLRVAAVRISPNKSGGFVGVTTCCLRVSGFGACVFCIVRVHGKLCRRQVGKRWAARTSKIRCSRRLSSASGATQAAWRQGQGGRPLATECRLRG